MITARKVFSLLTAREKRQAYWLVVLMVVCAVLEVAGLGLVVPALAALSGVESASSTALGGLKVFASLSRTYAILAGVAMLFILYLVKAAMLMYSTWEQVSFITQLQSRLSRTLFATYMSQPWSFHLRHNSATFVRNINDLTLLSNAAGSLFIIAAESLMISAILALLIWREPWGAVVVIAITVAAAYTLDLTVRERLRQWGKLLQYHAGETNRHLLQGLHAAKDVILLNRVSSFVECYSRERAASIDMLARQSLAAQVPRLWYELIAVTALCLLTAVMVLRGVEPAAMIPTLGLFAVAAFRMLPSVNRLAVAKSALHFSHSVIHTIEDDLRLPRRHISSVANTRFPLLRDISVQNVTFCYPSASEPTLKDISLRIPKGAAVGLIGESGAGKSTLVDVMLGLLPPTSGQVLVDGIDIATNLIGWRSNLGYVPQNIYLCDDTIKRNVAFGIPDAEIDIAAVHRALKAAQLQHFIETLADGLETKVGERGVRLSGGQRQRLGIARALYHAPSILVFDEATSALDDRTESEVMEAVEGLRAEKSLIIIAHRMPTVERCDIIYRLSRGRVIASGAYADVVKHS
jgi:ABC-type multidrug transport system fused ATPase/permease subunit